MKRIVNCGRRYAAALILIVVFMGALLAVIGTALRMSPSVDSLKVSLATSARSVEQPGETQLPQTAPKTFAESPTNLQPAVSVVPEMPPPSVSAPRGPGGHISGADAPPTSQPGPIATSFDSADAHNAPPVAPSPRSGPISPAAPEYVVVTALTDGTIEVNWSEPSPDAGIVRYEVTRDGGAVATVTSTRFTDSGLQAATLYCYAVSGIDAAGQRSAPSPAVCQSLRDIFAPTAPGKVITTVDRPNTVVLSWAPSTDDSGRVWYEVLDDGAVLVTLQSSTWTHRNAAPCDHRYAVRAVDDAGNRSIAGPATRVALGDLEPPTTPAGVSLSPVSPTQLAVRWTASSDNVEVDHYDVVVGGNVVVRSGSTAAVAWPLSEWEEHCVSVRAVDSAGNQSSPSPPVCGRTMDRGAWEARGGLTSNRR